MNIKSKCFSVSVKRTRCYTGKSNISVYQEKLFYADSIEDVIKTINKEIEVDKNTEENIEKIYSDDDYEFDILQLKYLVLTEEWNDYGGDKAYLNLVEKVNKHIEKGWKPLGGIQIAGAGGDSSDSFSGWSKWTAAQSLVCYDC